MAYLTRNSNGIAAAANSAAVTLPVQHIAGTLQSSPSTNYEFFTNSTNGWFDAIGYSWVSFTITITVAGSGGTVALEATNDTGNMPNGVGILAQQISATSTDSSPSRSSSITIAAATGTFRYEAPIGARFIRLRVTSAPGGTLAVSATFKQAAAPSFGTYITPTGPLAAGTNSIGTIKLAAGNNTFGATLPTTAKSTDTSVGTAYLLPDAPAAAAFCLSVTTLSSVTLSAVISESVDGVNFNEIYRYDTISQAGTYPTPVLRLNGPYVKYAKDVTGTGSITMPLYRLSKPVSVGGSYTFFDHNISPNTLSSTTAIYCTSGATSVTAFISSSTATTGCTIALQGSTDKQQWYVLAGSSAVGSNQNVALILNAMCGIKWVRCIVTTAGSGQTFNYIAIQANGLHL